MKTIYDEALQELKDATTDLENLEIIHSYDVSKIETALKQAQEQEKLLGLYRQLVKDLGLFIEHDTTDTWDGPEDYEYLEIDYDSIKALNTYKQIKELENE